MENRFTHIFRSTVITLLMTGFMAHLLVPFFGDVQKTEFTQWLNHNVVASGSDTEMKLRHTIRELPRTTSDFHSLVKEATELVANHKEGFRIAPFTAGEEGDHVTSWLISQWSVFKHQQNGTNAILPELIKPIQKWITQTGDYLNGIKPVYERSLQHAKQYFPVITPSDFSRVLPPLVFGISINAP